MKYTWKFYKFDADANKVGKELENINPVGELTNKEVLEYAEKHRDSEISKCFDWDNESASNKWRLHQATSILTNISIVIDDKEPIRETRVYVSTKSKNDEKRVFKKLVDVLEDDKEYKKILAKASDELNACEQKYRELIKLQDLKDIIFDIYKSI